MAAGEYFAHDVTVSRREAGRDRTSVLAVPVEVGRGAAGEPSAQQHRDEAGAECPHACMHACVHARQRC